MESVSERPDTFFRLSPADSGEVRYFAVRRGGLTSRWDFVFNDPTNWRGPGTIHPRPKFKELVANSFSGGTPSTSDPRLWNGSIPWVSPKDFGDLEISETQDHLTEAGLKAAKLALAKPGSVLVVVRSGVLKHTLPVATNTCSVAVNQDVRAFVPTDNCLSRFLVWYLRCFQDRILRLVTKHGTTVQSVNTNEFMTLPVPLPSIKEQIRLVAEMDTAWVKRKTKLAEADALLAGLDNFVLETLGLESHPRQKAVFAVRATDILSSRFDPDFHSLQFRTIRNRIEKGRYPARSLAELCEHFITGFAAGRQNQAFEHESGVPHLRPLNLDVFGQLSLEGTKLVPKASVAEGNWCVRGEVLFNNTNSTEMVGKSAVFDLEQPCACSNHMTRLRPRGGVAPEYLAAVLNALRRLGYLGLLSTNFNNQAGINTTTLSQLRLPQPPVREQERIAVEVCRRRKEARRLRTEAEADWQAAKRWFEEQLLGPSAP